MPQFVTLIGQSMVTLYEWFSVTAPMKYLLVKEAGKVMFEENSVLLAPTATVMLSAGLPPRFTTFATILTVFP